MPPCRLSYHRRQDHPAPQGTYDHLNTYRCGGTIDPIDQVLVNRYRLIIRPNHYTATMGAVSKLRVAQGIVAAADAKQGVPAVMGVDLFHQGRRSHPC